MLTIAASTIGLAFATVAGMTAVALFLPAAFFIGGTIAAFSVLGTIFSLVSLLMRIASSLKEIKISAILLYSSFSSFVHSFEERLIVLTPCCSNQF